MLPLAFLELLSVVHFTNQEVGFRSRVECLPCDEGPTYSTRSSEYGF